MHLFKIILASMVMIGPALAATAAERTPILIDTDLGAAIDDTFALGLALGSEEVQLQGLTTVGADARKKAMLACRLFTATGRRNTRVAVGDGKQVERPITDLYKYYYHPDALFNRTTKPVDEPATEFLFQRLRQHQGALTIVALGPLTNLAYLIDEHPQARKLIRQVVALESNLTLDPGATAALLDARVPLTIVSTKAVDGLRLTAADLKQVFAPGTTLTRQMQAMYQMWDQAEPPLGDALAVAYCIDVDLVQVEPQTLAVDRAGALQKEEGPANVQMVVAVKEGFNRWYAERIGGLVSPVDKPSQPIAPGRMPHRVHVAEDFDNDIERFWWMSGKPETKLLPPGGVRACRGVLTHDFDALLMSSRKMYTAVVFNPVPGPPMGKNPRLAFRYYLQGTDTLRVQLYSLTNGYHRQLVLTGLPQGEWRHAAVDMTEARRPDGTGGPLSEGERIDDIQFYIDPDAQIVVDDVVLYDAADQEEERPFPKRILFTGLFDTGNQKTHWLGDFEIVPDAGYFWKAARSVANKDGGSWVRLELRGLRALGAATHLAFRYKGPAEKLQVELVNSKQNQTVAAEAEAPAGDGWHLVVVPFPQNDLAAADEVRIQLPSGEAFFIDDLLLYEP